MDTKKLSVFDNPVDINLAILYSHRRDLAIGLPRTGARTLSLTGYYQRQFQEGMRQAQEIIGSLSQAAFLKAMVSMCQAEIHKLVERADMLPAEKQHDALATVQRLHDLARRASVELEKLSDG